MTTQRARPHNCCCPILGLHGVEQGDAAMYTLLTVVACMGGSLGYRIRGTDGKGV